MLFDEARPVFRDRRDAGRQLAERLGQYKDENVVVLAVPRGGVPVAAEVAGRLGTVLDVIVTRKIQIPFNPEAGYGAVTEDGTLVLNEPLAGRLGLTKDDIQRQADEVRAEIARRGALYRGQLPPISLEGKTAILIDDGLASGFTMLAAIRSARQRGAAGAVVAVPVASGSANDLVRPQADDLVAVVVARTPIFAVASYYRNWYDLDDDGVIQYLEGWRKQHIAPGAGQE